MLGSKLIVLILQDFGVVGYTLLLSVIEYKTLVLRGDMEAAAEILPQIPQVCCQGAWLLDVQLLAEASNIC